MQSDHGQASCRIQPLVPRSVLAWLLHLANSAPSCCRDTFYNLKDRLLRQYGEFSGHDIQEITKECWGERRYDDHGDYDYLPCDASCRRCGGTGVFDRRWVRLQRWKFGRYTFHIPDGDTRIKPDSVQIIGRIAHKDYGKASREAELWLYLLTLQFAMWWQVLSTSAYAYPGLWPMCRLQRVAMWARMTFSWKRCWCGKRFPTWWRGYQCCKKCREPKGVSDHDDVPF